ARSRLGGGNNRLTHRQAALVVQREGRPQKTCGRVDGRDQLHHRRRRPRRAEVGRSSRKKMPNSPLTRRQSDPQGTFPQDSTQPFSRKRPTGPVGAATGRHSRPGDT
ncbi:unnamed protein product, partial [Ixodes hexagonus]